MFPHDVTAAMLDWVKERNSSHVGGVKYSFRNWTHFYPNSSFCFSMQILLLVTWAKTLYTRFNKFFGRIRMYIWSIREEVWSVIPVALVITGRKRKLNNISKYSRLLIIIVPEKILVYVSKDQNFTPLSIQTLPTAFWDILGKCTISIWMSVYTANNKVLLFFSC